MKFRTELAPRLKRSDPVSEEVNQWDRLVHPKDVERLADWLGKGWGTYSTLAYSAAIVRWVAPERLEHSRLQGFVPEYLSEMKRHEAVVRDDNPEHGVVPTSAWGLMSAYQRTVLVNPTWRSRFSQDERIMGKVDAVLQLTMQDIINSNTQECVLAFPNEARALLTDEIWAKWVKLVSDLYPIY